MGDEIDHDEDGLADARQRVHDPGAWVSKILGERNQRRLVAAFERGVPPEGLVVAARWWQLENYLRQLVYLELKGLLGDDWAGPLKQAAARHAEAEQRRYMASADDTYLLAHLDVTPLFDLIATYWDQCSSGIGMAPTVWSGKVEEIKPVRHRIAHCRRPHADDIDRIEQLLRDLEPAAGAVLRAYTDWWEPNISETEDSVVRDWVSLEHPDAQRLVPHGRNNKGIDFYLMCSRLPWAASTGTLTGTAGWFWVMYVVLRDCSLYIDDYLREPAVTRLLPLVGHIVQPHPSAIAVTFPAVGDPQTTSDAIGALFEAVFGAVHWSHDDEVRHPWRRVQAFDSRVDVEGVLSILAGLNPDDPLSVFGAQRP